MKTTNITTNRKVRKSLVGVFLLTGIFMGNAQNIIIPDPNFKSALLTHSPVIDLNSDGEISYTEAAVFTGTMNVSDSNITLMVGIEYFVQLTELICYDNNIIALDVSSNTALEFLHCSNNDIYTLDVSGNPNLETLWASNNNLTSIDTSDCPALESLSVQNNNLTGTLNVQTNTALMYLECFGNNLNYVYASGLSLIQLSAYNNPNLYGLYCANNELTNLNLSGLPNLDLLSCGGNNLTSLDVSNKPNLWTLSCNGNALTELDLSGCPILRDLNCSNNNLTSLDFSNNPDLEGYLECYNNNLTSLNVSSNPYLLGISCSNNSLTSLDVSNNPILDELYCHSNNLTSLDVSNNPTLYDLNCSSNNLTSLDVSNNPNLAGLNCYNNNLTSLNLANGSNSIIGIMWAYNNDLDCIRIDSGFTPPTDGSWEKDPGTEYSADCALSVSDYQTQAVTVYPNPAQDRIFFESAEDIQNIAIYNLSGSKIKELSLSGTNAELSVAELSAGMYFAEVQTAKGRETLKIIKK